jgi:hypothetical protein
MLVCKLRRIYESGIMGITKGSLRLKLRSRELRPDCHHGISGAMGVLGESKLAFLLFGLDRDRRLTLI